MHSYGPANQHDQAQVALAICMIYAYVFRVNSAEC